MARPECRGGYPRVVDRIVVRSSGPLEGDVHINGAKNSVLKLMAATTMAEGTYRIRNVPAITDVEIMGDLLRAMGSASTPQSPAS